MPFNLAFYAELTVIERQHLCNVTTRVNVIFSKANFYKMVRAAKRFRTACTTEKHTCFGSARE